MAKSRTAPPVGLAADQGQNEKASRLLWAAALAPDGPMAEIGCLRYVTEWRYDGWSTVYLARFAEEHGRKLHSFDIDAAAVRKANAALKQQGYPAVVKRKDGAAALAELPALGFLYLDGSDDPAEALAQYHAAKLLPGAILVADDVQMLDWNKLQGKATDLIPVLQEEGHPYRIYPTEPGFSMLVCRVKGESI